MCGVPVERADDYLNRLIALGHRVAVCEQLEDPAEAKKRGAKSVVRRDVVRLVTPGTITEERLLEPGRARLMVAVQKVRPGVRAAGSMALRRSIFRPAHSPCRRPTKRGSRRRSRGWSRARSSPRRRSMTSASSPRSSPKCACRRRRSGATAATARRRSAGYASSTASRPSTASARSRAPRSPPPRSRWPMSSAPNSRPGPRSRPRRGARAGTSLEIDPATRANLELTRTLSGARDGSLLATIDLTVTPAGARLLAERLASPLTDPEAINRRLDSLDFLVEAAPMRDALRRALAACARFSARARAPEPRPRRPARSRRDPRRPRRGGGARRHSGGRSGSPARPAHGLCAAQRRLRRARARSSSVARRRFAARQARRRVRAAGRACRRSTRRAPA